MKKKTPNFLQLTYMGMRNDLEGIVRIEEVTIATISETFLEIYPTNTYFP